MSEMDENQTRSNHKCEVPKPLHCTSLFFYRFVICEEKINQVQYSTIQPTLFTGNLCLLSMRDFY